jgi:hypothetical protein
MARFRRVWLLCVRNNRLAGTQSTLNVLVRNTHTSGDASKRTVKGCEICLFYFRILLLIITSVSLIMNFKHVTIFGTFWILKPKLSIVGNLVLCTAIT